VFLLNVATEQAVSGQSHPAQAVVPVSWRPGRASAASWTGRPYPAAITLQVGDRSCRRRSARAGPDVGSRLHLLL